MKTHSERLDDQMALEAMSIDLGIARYNETLARDGHAAVSAGDQLIRAAMEPMVAALADWKERTASGLASRSASVFHFLDQHKVEALAWLTAHTCISMLHEMPAVQRVATTLTLRIEQSINVDSITKDNPKLAERLAKRLAQPGAERNKAIFVRKAGVLADVKMVQWDDSVRVRVGTLLVEMFAQSTGLIAIELVRAAAGRSKDMVRATESCRRWLDESHARCELLSPVRLPMVCRPRNWTNPFNGGYLTAALRQPLIKTRNKAYLSELKEEELPWVYASVNALQDTAWAVNRKVHGVVRQLWEAGSSLGGLPSREDAPLPAKNWDEAHEPAPEVLTAWKTEAAKVYEENKKAESVRLQTSQKLWVAEQMLNHGNAFHYVYNLDWRGRMYPVGPALTPQGDDVAKSLLQFAHGSPLGDDGAYWLAVHAANSFGVDKVSFAERIQWVQDNEDMLLASAADPYIHRGWAEADSPFVFLAACFEWAALQAHVDQGGRQEDFVSHIAVAFDGSCNGLQNFSALLRDEVGGKATGLVPSDTPSDIYSAVAAAAQRIIDRDAAEVTDVRLGARAAKGKLPEKKGELLHEVASRWVGKMSRKLAKRNTMTVPYGVTKRGMQGQMYQELKKQKLSSAEHLAIDSGYLASCNYEAIGQVVVAAREAMDWLKAVADVMASNDLPVRWTTPAGLPVLQDYREEVGERCDFTVLGRRFSLMLTKTGDNLDVRKQSLGIAPNFVHSLDAAHLMRTVLFCAADGMRDFAMIHDSYGCHAGRAGLLRDNLRAAFIEQYSLPVLEKFRDELAAQLPEELRAELPALPRMGTLDLELVRTSDYFFA